MLAAPCSTSSCMARTWLHVPLVVLLCGATAAPAQVCSGKEVYSQLPESAVAAAAQAEPLVCVVVRTYHGHSDRSGGGLRQLVKSLQRQTVSAYAPAPPLFSKCLTSAHWRPKVWEQVGGCPAGSGQRAVQRPAAHPAGPGGRAGVGVCRVDRAGVCPAHGRRLDARLPRRAPPPDDGLQACTRHSQATLYVLLVAQLSAAWQACCTTSRIRRCAHARPARSGW